MITNKVKILIICGALLLCALFALTVCLVKPTLDSSSAETEIIETNSQEEYLKSYAAKMLSYMNQSVQPCDDFYEYACGNWNHVTQEKLPYIKRSIINEILYVLGDLAEELILSNSTLAKDLGYANEMNITQQFYNACRNAELYPLPASDPAYLALIRSIGGFPAVDGEAWTPSNFSWFNMSSHLTNYGAQGLINEKTIQKHPFKPYFELPQLGFDYIVHSDNIATNDTRAYKLNEKRMRGYLKSYGLADEQVAEVIAGVFAFWHDVLDIVDRFKEDKDICLRITRLTLTTPFSQWRYYYAIAWNSIQFEEPDRYCDYYYIELDKVCAKHKTAVANYLAMKLLYQMDAKLKTSNKFQRDYCALTIQYSLPYLLDKLYYVKYFSEETRTDVDNIIGSLRKSQHLLLKNANWLDEATRREALAKESFIVSRIGSFRDDKLLDALIRETNNLIFIPGTYVQNNINLKKFSRRLKRYNGLNHKHMSNDTIPPMMLKSMQANAFYGILDNSINVMAGCLHPPIYHQAWPNSLKFGTIGNVIGHELAHGFDTAGSFFDSKGKLRIWYTTKSMEEFTDRAQCFVDHYNKYLIPEINRKMNGEQTKNENIADNVGLRFALYAYRSYIKQRNIDDPSHGWKSEQMPGLDMSPEKVFFLGFAQLWCAAYEEKDFWVELTDRHTADKYRLLGAVTNNEDFAQVYNCSLGSPMNPKADKCRIW